MPLSVQQRKAVDLRLLLACCLRFSTRCHCAGLWKHVKSGSPSLDRRGSERIIVADKDKSPTTQKREDWPRQGDRNTTGENHSIESSVAHKHMRRESGNINHNGDDETMLHCFFFKKRHVTLLHASGNRTFHSMIVHFYFSGKTRQKHNLAVMLIH